MFRWWIGQNSGRWVRALVVDFKLLHIFHSDLPAVFLGFYDAFCSSMISKGPYILRHTSPCRGTWSGHSVVSTVGERWWVLPNIWDMMVTALTSFSTFLCCNTSPHVPAPNFICTSFAGSLAWGGKEIVASSHKRGTVVAFHVSSPQTDYKCMLSLVKSNPLFCTLLHTKCLNPQILRYNCFQSLAFGYDVCKAAVWHCEADEKSPEMSTVILHCEKCRAERSGC